MTLGDAVEQFERRFGTVSEIAHRVDGVMSVTNNGVHHEGDADIKPHSTAEGAVEAWLISASIMAGSAKSLIWRQRPELDKVGKGWVVYSRMMFGELT